MKYMLIKIIFVHLLFHLGSCSKQLFQFLQHNSFNIPQLNPKQIQDSKNNHQMNINYTQTKQPNFVVCKLILIFST